MTRARVRALHLLVPAVLASAMALAPPDAGAADESGHGIQVTVHDGRVSVFAADASIEDIVRAMTKRTGVEISVVTRGRFVATVAIEKEPLDRALERVLRAISPPVHGYSILSYDDERLTAINVVLRGTPGRPVADGGDGAVENHADPVSQPLSAVDRETLTSELRAAGLAEPQLDEPRLLAARQLRSDGVAVHEIVETLRATGPEPSGFVAGDAPLVSEEAGQSLRQQRD